MPRFVFEFDVDDVVKKAKSAGKSAKETARSATLEILRSLHKEIGRAVERLERKPKGKKPE